jgi:hypothetical protein
MDEKWVPISGFDGYDVSDAGNVRSWRVDGTSPARRTTPRTLNPWKQQGYPFVNLSLGAKCAKKAIHRLVCAAFNGERPAGYQASHLNGDRGDCRASNLAWETPRDNNNRKRDHGTWQCGEAHGCCDLPSEMVEFIRLVGKFKGAKRYVANALGMSETHIGAIANGRSRVSG